MLGIVAAKMVLRVMIATVDMTCTAFELATASLHPHSMASSSSITRVGFILVGIAQIRITSKSTLAAWIVFGL